MDQIKAKNYDNVQILIEKAIRNVLEFLHLDLYFLLLETLQNKNSLLFSEKFELLCPLESSFC